MSDGVKGWVSVQLWSEIVAELDKLKAELKARSRSEVIQKLINFYKKHRGVKSD